MMVLAEAMLHLDGKSDVRLFSGTSEAFLHGLLKTILWKLQGNDERAEKRNHGLVLYT